MSKPIFHARNSARKFGGKPEDYLFIHDQMDEPKSHHASVRFRSIFHSSYGIFLIEKILGHEFTNSAGKVVAVRSVAEQHVLEDLGWIPSLDDYLKEMGEPAWMAGAKTVKYTLVD